MTLDPVSRRLIALALREDLGRRGDITTRFFLPPSREFHAKIVAKEPGVLCGVAPASEVFRRAAPRVRVRWSKRDGDLLRGGQTIAVLVGPRQMLGAERVALNFLQRLSGIATLTAAFVAKTRGTRARIYDTRKTAPGWRALDKHAVLCGGGRNHRFGLYDMAMLKDNHRAGETASKASWKRRQAEMRDFRRRYPRVAVEIEAKTRAEVDAAIALGADILLLDNMTPAALRREIPRVRRAAPKIAIEVSGGVDLKGVRRVALLGPDRISVGTITHSAKALDMSLELEG